MSLAKHEHRGFFPRTYPELPPGELEDGVYHCIVVGRLAHSLGDKVTSDVIEERQFWGLILKDLFRIATADPRNPAKGSMALWLRIIGKATNGVLSDRQCRFTTHFYFPDSLLRLEYLHKPVEQTFYMSGMTELTGDPGKFTVTFPNAFMRREVIKMIQQEYTKFILLTRD